jgi:hypothetical protein
VVVGGPPYLPSSRQSWQSTAKELRVAALPASISLVSSSSSSSTLVSGSQFSCWSGPSAFQSRPASSHRPNQLCWLFFFLWVSFFCFLLFGITKKNKKQKKRSSSKCFVLLSSVCVSSEENTFLGVKTIWVIECLVCCVCVCVCCVSSNVRHHHSEWNNLILCN